MGILILWKNGGGELLTHSAPPRLCLFSPFSCCSFLAAAATHRDGFSDAAFLLRSLYGKFEMLLVWPFDALNPYKVSQFGEVKIAVIKSVDV